MPPQSFQSQPQDVNINGLFLSFYLDAMGKVQDTFGESGDKGLPAFNKHVFFLRSIISDDNRIKKIDQEMKKERERLFGTDDKGTGMDPEVAKDKSLDDETKNFMIGFTVIHGCVQYLDHTLSINKRHVKGLADQTDPLMPAPPENEDEDDQNP